MTSQFHAAYEPQPREGERPREPKHPRPRVEVTARADARPPRRPFFRAALPSALLLLALAAARSWAAEPPIRPGETPQSLMVNFKKRLETAIASRDLAAIQAFYQTNGIAAEDLEREMARWPFLLCRGTNARVNLFFKDLDTLPPQARAAHTEQAHRLTKYEVTHLVFVGLPAGYQLTLPLVLVDGRLLIVPSDKLNAGAGPKPDDPAGGTRATSTALAATLQEIERMPFDEAYGLWLKEQAALVPPPVVAYSYKDAKTGQVALSNVPHVEQPASAIALGSSDPKTGEFTPTSFWALTCRLGREAPSHELFLRGALATNAWVSAILDASASLCTKYHVESQALVRYEPKGGYTNVMRDWVDGPDTRKEVWLKALAKPAPKPDDPAAGPRPVLSEPNSPPAPAGSGR
jgi:hypothetical protein